MIKVNEHTVGELSTRTRLLDYALGLFPQLPSRNSVKKAIKRGELLLNGAHAEQGRWLEEEDKIELFDLELKPPKTYEMDLEVLFEDDHLAIINKPAGIVVSGNQFRTIENTLLDNLKPSKAIDALKWPKPVHRLDHPTSGLLVIAKTASAHMHIGQQFENRSIRKTYRAIVKGLTDKGGRFDNPIGGHSAVTEYLLLDSVPSLQSGHLSLLELHPLTGRTHQLRIHLSEQGHPIIGDKLYDKPEETILHKGLFLAAVKLKLQHPATDKEISVSITEPNKFASLMEREERRWKKFKGDK